MIQIECDLHIYKLSDWYNVLRNNCMWPQCMHEWKCRATLVTLLDGRRGEIRMYDYAEAWSDIKFIDATWTLGFFV